MQARRTFLQVLHAFPATSQIVSTVSPVLAGAPYNLGYLGTIADTSCCSFSTVLHVPLRCTQCVCVRSNTVAHMIVKQDMNVVSTLTQL